MILIDKSKPVQQVVISVFQNTTITNPDYQLIISSDSTSKNYTFQLSTNLSPSRMRFDLFELETALFNDVESGFYSFKIFQDDTLIKEVLRGKLYVKGLEKPDEYITPESDLSGYISYNG